MQQETIRIAKKNLLLVFVFQLSSHVKNLDRVSKITDKAAVCNFGRKNNSSNDHLKNLRIILSLVTTNKNESI